MPLKELYVKLLSIRHKALLLIPPLQPPFPVWYKSKLTYKYYDGNLNHDTETYYTFKKRLLELIKIG
jgi:hypothetical protein